LAGAGISVTPGVNDITIASTIAGGTDNHFPYWLAGALTGTSQLRNDAGNLLLTRSGAVDTLLTIRAETTTRAAILRLRNNADAEEAAIQYAGLDRLYITSPRAINVVATTSASIQGTSIILQESAGSYTYLVDATGFIWQSVAPVQLAKLTIAGDMILGTGSKETNAKLTVRIAAGLALGGATVKMTDANSYGFYRACSDNSAKYATVRFHGSGVGETLYLRSLVNAACFVGMDAAEVLYGSQSTTEFYLPVTIGQEASGNNRWQIHVDASGNVVINSANALYIGASQTVATDGMFRLVLTSGELNIEKRVAGSYVTNVGTFQGVGTGSGYNLTATYAKIDFGTTDPSFVITRPGTYLILVRGTCESNFILSTGGYIHFKVRRTNNGAADISPQEGLYYYDDATYAEFEGPHGLLVPPTIYTTANTDDNIEVWGKTDNLPSSGNISVAQMVITAVRLR
jgi:hypothetical protein